MLEPTIDSVPFSAAPTSALQEFAAGAGEWDYSPNPGDPPDAESIARSIAASVLVVRCLNIPGGIR